VPAQQETAARTIAQQTDRDGFLDARATLGNYDNFTLAAIAGAGDGGGRNDVYVHSKLMLVDDAWATIGSCNLHSRSLFGSSEMNAAIWDPAFARSLRCELLAEHLGTDTSHLDDRAALRHFARVARANRDRREAGDNAWLGLAFSLDSGTYGR
jgi:cardiolipin synthase A/B